MRKIFGKNVKSSSLVLVGDSGVGKTELINQLRYMENPNMYIRGMSVPTYGVDILVKECRLNIEQIMNIYIWDTCGSTRLRPSALNFIKSYEMFCIVYQISWECTCIEEYISRWLCTIDDTSKKYNIFIVGLGESDINNLKSNHIKNFTKSLPFIICSMIITDDIPESLSVFFVNIKDYIFTKNYHLVY